MKITDLNNDILYLIQLELYSLRANKSYQKVQTEFHTQWYERRPHYRVFQSRRKINEGRAFLHQKVGMLLNSKFPFNHYIYGIKLKNYMYSYRTNEGSAISKCGLTFSHEWSKKKIIQFCQENKWDDYTNEKEFYTYLLWKEKDLDTKS